MRSINVNRMIDEAKFNRFHALVVFWCAYVIIFDGYDLGLLGAVLPVLMEEWSLSPVQAGALGSYALFGMVFGSLIGGPLADKIGRKNVIMFCVAFFSLFTVMCGFAQGPTEFAIYRFLLGLGLGGVVPNAVALTSEYAPRSLRSFLTTTMFSGYAAGGVLAAGIGILLIPNFGWQSVFFIGGVPLLTLPLMYKTLPDSVEFLVVKKQNDRVSQVLAKINPAHIPQPSDVYEMALPQETGFPVTRLFGRGRAVSTLMFWIASFLCLLVIYGLNTWLPKLMANAGYNLGSSLLFLLVLNFGAIMGCLIGGWASDRWRGKKVLITYFILGFLSLTLLGYTNHTLVLYLLVAIAGASTIGTQIILYAYVAQYYPMEIRSTGIGWTTGVGRMGSVVGPMLGGLILTLSLPLQQNFLAFAIPALICVFAILLVKERHGAQQALRLDTAKKDGELEVISH